MKKMFVEFWEIVTQKDGGRKRYELQIENEREKTFVKRDNLSDAFIN